MISNAAIPTLPAVPCLWPGETAVIVGGGSSLTPLDVAYVGDRAIRGMVRCIAIKEAFLLAPWADVLYGCDAKFWRFYRGVPSFTKPKYTLEAVEYPDVICLQNTGNQGLELDPTGLRTGYNSGYQAVNLAYHLGIRKVILLGFDMWRGPSGEANWFGAHPNHLDSPYPIFHQSFEQVKGTLKNLGMEVVNASRWTMLRTFPCVRLEDELP